MSTGQKRGRGGSTAPWQMAGPFLCHPEGRPAEPGGTSSDEDQGKRLEGGALGGAGGGAKGLET